ncbi:threonine/serine dehydratase [bacterium]
MLFTDLISQIYKRINVYIRKTPILRSDFLSDLTGNEVYFKCENLQITHAFKVRGAINKVLSIPKNEVQNKILVTASGGNHGLAVTYAARVFGLKAFIYLPHSTPDIKIKAIQDLGGQVKMTGDVWDEANEQAMILGQQNDYYYIHPFDDDSIIQGQATIAYEMFQQLEHIDIVMASIGGGGLISGIAQYAKGKKPQIKVYGVETKGADSMAQSVQARKLITLPSISSKAESLGAKTVSEKTLSIAQENVDDFFVVDDSSARQQQLRILHEEKLLVELASSCVVSAYLQNVANKVKNKNILIVLCGGNTSLDFI